DPDPFSPLGGEEWRPSDDPWFIRDRSVGGNGSATGEIPDRELLDPDRDLARAGRTLPDERSRPQRELPARLWRFPTFGLKPLQPRLVLVHLAELAMAAVALDELLLPGDRLGLVLDVLRHPRVALFALPVVGAVV